MLLTINNDRTFLGIKNVNDLCLEIYNFAQQNTFVLSFSFWTEMMVQYSRTNKYMIKLVINPIDDNQYHTFKQMVAPQLVKHLTSTEKYGKNIDSIVYQKCPSLTSKPCKYDEYYVLYGDGTLSHSTAVFNLPLSLSCNTFCEPNLAMECKQFEHIMKWLTDLSNNKRFTLIAKGREIIPYVCEIHHQLTGLLDLIIAISPCKRVYKDAWYNFEKHLNDVPFYCYYSDHNDHNDMTECCKAVSRDRDNEIICMITAGRNGLSPKFVQWIKSLDNVDRVIYSSCNQKVTFREIQWFLKGDNGFIIHDYCILDMHPSTSYNTFFACFKKKRKYNKTLIIPIGGYKVGKTYFIEHLQKSMAMNDDDGDSEIMHFNRDNIFYSCKANNLSFKKSKQLTHEQLDGVLLNCNKNILYLDSTNTQKDARLYYCDKFRPNKLILINFVMDPNMESNDKNVLLQQMVENGNDYRIKNSIPMDDKHMDIAKMVELYQSVWDNLQEVDENELAHIRSTINTNKMIDIVVFEIDVTDFSFRADLCFNIMQRIFCNAM